MGEAFAEIGYRDATTARPSDVLPGDARPLRFEDEDDFGDGGRHEILLECHPPAGPRERYPIGPDGEATRPAEDAAGIRGQADLRRSPAPSRGA
jgi:hypothetical protein